MDTVLLRLSVGEERKFNSGQWTQRGGKMHFISKVGAADLDNGIETRDREYF